MLNGKYVPMEFDSGAAVSCMNRKIFDDLKLTGVHLMKCNMKLCVANGQLVVANFKAMLVVKFNNCSLKLPLFMVDAPLLLCSG